MRKNILIFTATYNEAENIKDYLDKIDKLNLDYKLEKFIN